MEQENIKKLAFYLDTAFAKQGHTITNPQYTYLYSEIFIDEIKNNNGKPLPYERFNEQLALHLNMDSDNDNTILNEFMTVWNTWTHLYRELNRKNWNFGNE